MSGTWGTCKAGAVNGFAAEPESDWARVIIDEASLTFVAMTPILEALWCRWAARVSGLESGVPRRAALSLTLDRWRTIVAGDEQRCFNGAGLNRLLRLPPSEALSEARR
eukprot:CAMPEP_0173102106 /NCGR_PEP_ID=MMETSP1102-20130122/37330_1 /TAXON_ID=49646 /ORGANISM="Geminigera sp., Strain Caron Lab Isolate" /LENGTH=108 /DNA_ID=CAMNT_0013996133 /DNA_START=1709 /DNA_END=2036 /DNA_ORIENTATION=-